MRELVSRRGSERFPVDQQQTRNSLEFARVVRDLRATIRQRNGCDLKVIRTNRSPTRF